MAREQPEGPARTILLVDGDVLVRHELAEYLRHCGYRVVEASTTDEAVTVLSEGGVALDALLCHAEAAGERNGFALAAWVRANRPGLPVLLAGSTERTAEAAGELCEEGPDLARPYDPAVVVDRIRRRLATRARSRSDRARR